MEWRPQRATPWSSTRALPQRTPRKIISHGQFRAFGSAASSSRLVRALCGGLDACPPVPPRCPRVASLHAQFRRCVFLAPRSPSRTPPHAVRGLSIESQRACGTVLGVRRKWASNARPSVRAPFRTRALLVSFILVHPRRRLSSPSRHPASLLPLVAPVYPASPESSADSGSGLGLGADAVAVCALHLRRVPAHIEGCRLSVSSAECRMCADAQPLIPLSSFTHAFASRPLIYPPAFRVPSSPPYTPPIEPSAASDSARMSWPCKLYGDKLTEHVEVLKV
ncbi:hypothetical protein C8F04DRAFT_1397608 [Mycena alexandri]|uniref:Uncharacterized protein n=1 Tax=Mycena alexandri TaxID=1745969 RepID=A0AAD6SN43_9AGAR|nr:hypothetical protein C8F04DRAFT_1397608 [Mycena alexandri]